MNQWQALLDGRKDRGLRDFSNGFLMPVEIGRHVDDGTALFADEDDVLALFLMQDDFARAYVFVDQAYVADESCVDDHVVASAAAAFAALGIPVLVEFTYRDSLSAKAQALALLLEHAGFVSYTNEQRWGVDLQDAAAGPCVQAVRTDDMMLAPCDGGRLSEAVLIWRQNLQPYQTFLPSHEALKDLAAAQQVLIACDPLQSALAAAMLFRINGATATFGPIAVDACCRGRGLSKSLYAEAVARLLALPEDERPRRIVAWVQDDNVASAALHEVFGFSPDGNRVQSYLWKPSAQQDRSQAPIRLARTSALQTKEHQ